VKTEPKTTRTSTGTGTGADTGTGSSVVLRAEDLVVEYTTRHGRVRSLDSASLSIETGQIVALVGESGSGKTTLGMAAGRLLASNAHHVAGTLTVAGRQVFDCDAGQLRTLRRRELGFVFQNPVAALDPTMRVEHQMRAATRAQHRAAGADDDTGPPGSLRDELSSEVLTAALADVGLKDVRRVLRSFPHELSGGMAQRVAIAMVLRRRPRLLVADEPTAAVDATLRAQILTLLIKRCRDQGCALLLLTHDLHAVAEHTEHIAVMYGGRIVEAGPTADVLTDPRHPYTQALISALPGEEEPGQRLHAIQGVPPVLHGPSPGCAFTPRCPHALDHCPTTPPPLTHTHDRHLACHLHPPTDRSRPAGGHRPDDTEAAQ
jgi:peptide/nickel transport system ATP-binding protein